jgi:hypothetical protein
MADLEVNEVKPSVAPSFSSSQTTTPFLESCKHVSLELAYEKALAELHYVGHHYNQYLVGELKADGNKMKSLLVEVARWQGIVQNIENQLAKVTPIVFDPNKAFADAMLTLRGFQQPPIHYCPIQHQQQHSTYNQPQPQQ